MGEGGFGATVPGAGVACSPALEVEDADEDAEDEMDIGVGSAAAASEEDAAVDAMGLGVTAAGGVPTGAFALGGGPSCGGATRNCGTLTGGGPPVFKVGACVVASAMVAKGVGEVGAVGATTGR